MTTICKNCGKPIVGRAIVDHDLNCETGEVEINYIHYGCKDEYLDKLEKESDEYQAKHEKKSQS
jgi:hypothetical protein